ncbi:MULTISPECIES: hypothetical protein [unclassified Brevundimonas]|uniref:hypothetical protein n=1 Tax=unclassified Brevundimonas TaxID=2622653 RepID=UPI0025C0B886|nr:MULTISPECIES: hypothetical protein [unclassified Brevundimonas]
MTRPLWQIAAEIAALKAEKKAQKRMFHSPNKLRSQTFRPESKGQRDPRQQDKAYLAWLHEGTDCIACLIEGRPAFGGGGAEVIEAAHQKLAIASKGWREGGLGPRVHDRRCVPPCAWHHRLAPNSCDTGGQRKFWDRLGLRDGIADFCADLNAAFDQGQPAMPVIRKWAARPANDDLNEVEEVA